MWYRLDSRLPTQEIIAGPFYMKDPVTMQCAVLKSVCFDQDRIKSLAVFEWARLHSNK